MEQAGHLSHGHPPVDELEINRTFGPHLSVGTRGTSADQPDKLVKTHCCFCGQQCGIQLKVAATR